MKKENITISMEQEKLRAIKRYMAKRGLSAEGELLDALQKLYEKHVPNAVREYIDETATAGTDSRRVSTPTER